jgi:hypothetical protein
MSTSTQVASQALVPPRHAPSHTPALQASPSEHATPHAPQWLESLASATHCPAQSTWPSAHVGTGVVDDEPEPQLACTTTAKKKGTQIPCPLSKHEVPSK